MTEIPAEGGDHPIEGEEYGDEEGAEDGDADGMNPFAALASNPNFEMIR